VKVKAVEPASRDKILPMLLSVSLEMSPARSGRVPAELPPLLGEDPPCRIFIEPLAPVNVGRGEYLDFVGHQFDSGLSPYGAALSLGPCGLEEPASGFCWGVHTWMLIGNWANLFTWS
jgi:hypothetical protein